MPELTTPPGIILSSLGMMAASEREKIYTQSLSLLGVASFTGIKVAIMPAASERLYFKGFVSRSVQHWRSWGAEVSVVSLPAEPETVQKALHQADIIYVPGGNTYTLMRRLAQAGVKEYLPALLDQRLYIGESAGSIVAGPNVGTAILTLDHNPEYAFTDRTALNLLPFSVWPHYSSGSAVLHQLRERLLPVSRRGAFAQSVERIMNGEILIYRQGEIRHH